MSSPRSPSAHGHPRHNRDTTGELSDISAQGCCLKTVTMPLWVGPLRVGARLILRGSGVVKLAGTIRWIRGEFAGLEFDREVCQAAIERRFTLPAQGSHVRVSRG